MQSAEVWIRSEPDPEGVPMYVCGDEDGEFARCYSTECILHYANDLIVGPGTLKSGGLHVRTGHNEDTTGSDSASTGQI